MGESREETTEAPVDRSNHRGGAPARERELRAQGKKTMRKLQQAGMKVFGKKGYHQARVDDIVKLAKTSHGTFYLYFSNKEDLLLALMQDCAEEMAHLAERLPPVTPGDEGYAALSGWLSEFVDLYRYYGPVIQAWTEAETSGAFRGEGQQVLASFAGSLADRISEADPHHKLNPGIAALAFVAMIERFNYYIFTRQIAFEKDDIVEVLATVLHDGLFGGTKQTRHSAPAEKK